MKKNGSMYAVLFGTVVFFICHSVAAQDSTAMNEYNARTDSLANAYERNEIAEDARKRSENLSDLKAEKSETKAKAKEAQRVESEANDAARESKMAYRKEKNAQKARQQADKQKRKAEKTRSISDQN